MVSSLVGKAAHVKGERTWVRVPSPAFSYFSNKTHAGYMLCVSRGIPYVSKSCPLDPVGPKSNGVTHVDHHAPSRPAHIGSTNKRWADFIWA